MAQSEYKPAFGENRVVNFRDEKPCAESLPDAMENCLDHYFNGLSGISPAPNLYDVIVQQVEKPLIEHVLRYVRGNQLRAAEILGINRNTLRKKITLLGIDPKNVAKK